MAFAIGWLVAIAAIFLFLVVLPQRRRMAAQRALLAGLKAGDEVVTGGGLYGRLRTLDDDGTARLEVADGVVVRIARAAVIGCVDPDTGTATEPGIEAGGD